MTVTSDTGLWGESLANTCQTKALERDITTDLVIIGAGYTGCAAALQAARLGASVTVLEARSIGYGGSGRNAGLVNAGLWLPPDKIIAHLGDKAGRRLIDALAPGPEQVFELIERHGIDCGATRKGTLHLAHSPAGLVDLQSRLRQGNAHGAALQLLDAEATRQATGSPAFHGALLNPQAGTVQPLGYCHGLAIAAQGLGARIFSETPAISITYDDDHWRVETQGGVVRAKAMLRATNAYPEAGARTRLPKFISVFYCQFATEPLPERTLESVLPEQHGCWDTAQVMTSFRRDAEGRIIIGGMGDATGLGTGAHLNWARRKLRAIFPQLPDPAFAGAWTGRIAMTSDHLPRIEALGPKALGIFGYSGRGIATGTLFGTAAARALLQDDPSHLPIAPVAQYAETFAGLKTAFYRAGALLAHTATHRF